MAAISFIIPALNSAEHIGRCLQSIVDEKAPEDEIILVDNGSIDATVTIAETFAGVRTFVLPDKTIGGLRNFGAEQAQNPILAFIDSDCILCPGWREAALETLADETIAATGPRCDVPAAASWVERAWSAQRESEPCDASFIGSANFVIRKDVFTDVSGFDETLATDEDVELGNRLWKNRCRIVDNPAVSAIHLGNPKTLRQFARQTAWRARGNTALFSHGKLDKPVLMTYVHLVLLLGLLPALVLSVMGAVPIWTALLMVAFVPVLTAAVRGHQFRIYRFIPALFVLYLVYYTARAAAMIGLYKKYWKS